MSDRIERFQRQGQRISASDILSQLAAGNDIFLEKCTVSGDLDISRLLNEEEGFSLDGISVQEEDEGFVISISSTISFRSCVFEGNVSFASPWETPGSLKVIFYKDVVFNSSEFGGQARFSGVEFRETAGFDGCGFRHITVFRGTKFLSNAYFRTAEFDGYGLFNQAVFGAEARFTNTCFTRGGNFTETRFESITDFSGVYAKSKSVPVYESVHFSRRSFGDDESFWRFIKQSAQEAGHYQLTGECFYRERCAHLWRRFRGNNYEELRGWGKFVRWFSGIKLLPELVLGRMLFGYGERPIRVLFASACVVIFCAMFYSCPYSELAWRADGHTGNPLFIDGLYFSTITFTTLGFGDVYPSPDHLLTRIVAMSEALCGVSLMSLFVVTLSKRYSRG